MGCNLKGSKVIGIDPSTSNTGIVVLNIDKDKVTIIDHVVLKPSKESKSLSRIMKYYDLAGRILNYIKNSNSSNCIIGMEGYGLNLRNSASVIPTIEFGAILRLLLEMSSIKYSEIRPSVMKKFITGRGNAKKSDVRDSIRKSYGASIDVLDEHKVDALGVALAAYSIYSKD